MKGSIRVSAKTLDDAITEALIQLGVTSDRLEYNVIEKGSAGFLGIGMKQAVIEAWKKEDKEEEEFLKAVEETIRENPVKEYFAKEDNVKEDDVKEHQAEEAAKKEEAVREEKTEKEEASANAKEEKSEPVSVKEKELLAKVEDETIRYVEQFVKDTLKAMDMDVEITSSIDKDGALYVDMKGENMGILIGKRGQTLDSLQYLANRVANKHQSGYVRVKLDTENYRARREETLKHLAKNIAHKVKRNRRPVILEPMNPYERRIIHSTLQSDPYVTTHSEGEEPYRKVVISASQPHRDNNRRNDRKGGRRNGNGTNRSYKQSTGFSTSFEREYKRSQTAVENTASDAGEFSKEAVETERNATLYGKIELLDLQKSTVFQWFLYNFELLHRQTFKICAK